MDYVHGLSELPQPNEYRLPLEELDTDFKRSFPPDPVGREMDDTARVWRVYREEARSYDSTLLEGWSSTLDILLIFAGIFSAVATAFVVESYQLLQPDNAAYTAAALYILVAASNHNTGIVLPAPPDLSFASSLTRWINGLWFTSILLSLSVALLSILVKQWITEYRARNNASAKSPRDWARRHQVYSHALNAWPVAEVVSFLPILLHLSLFLFFAGVVAFLWTLDQAIGIWIIALGLSLVIFYTACTLLPLWIPECPTSTPLVVQMRKVVLPLVLLLLRMSRTCIPALSFPQRVQISLAEVVRGLRRNSQTSMRDTPLSLVAPESHGRAPSLAARLDAIIMRVDALRHDKSAIGQQLERHRDDLDASTLYWLIAEVSDADPVAVGLQALGAVQPISALADKLRGKVADFATESAYTTSVAARSPTEMLRVTRSILCMCPPRQSVSWERISALVALREPEYPDIALFSSPLNVIMKHAATWRASAPSVTSTAVHAIRSSPHPGLAWRLARLLCCDFERFSDADWALVFQAIDSDEAVMQAAPQTYTRSADLSYARRLAGALAHVAPRRYENEEHRMAAELIPRLLTWDMSHNPTRFQFKSLSSQPFLLQFLASTQYLNQKHEMDEIENISQFLWLETDLLAGNSKTARTFWCALGCITHIADSVGPTPKGLSALLFVSFACQSAISACRQSPAMLTAMLKGILTTDFASLPINQSIWTTLAAACSGVSLGALILAETLAAALSIHTRREDSSARSMKLVDMFFARLERTPLWTSLASGGFFWDTTRKSLKDGYAGDRPVHFVQHCIELRPQWWLDTLSHMLNGESDDARLLVLEIDKAVSIRGRCLQCPVAISGGPLQGPPVLADVNIEELPIDDVSLPEGGGPTEQDGHSCCSFRP